MEKRAKINYLNREELAQLLVNVKLQSCSALGCSFLGISSYKRENRQVINMPIFALCARNVSWLYSA